MISHARHVYGNKGPNIHVHRKVQRTALQCDGRSSVAVRLFLHSLPSNQEVEARRQCCSMIKTHIYILAKERRCFITGRQSHVSTIWCA